MPIHIIPELGRTWLQFGSGDIHITEAVKDDGEPCVIFHQMEPVPLGSSRPELDGTPCDDFGVGMTFTDPRSIDAIIAVLADYKEKHFAAKKGSNE